ncbi:MAG: pyridoxine 5'-phosphate synthase [Endomicrobium sp.]|jgi:pyridoxine 5-phosphate synthase|nr:pyridoxine 5'-phosphate synthase [Endomicrobium sp.]
MSKLGVNIDHIATIRQARKENFPSLIEAAKICENNGADSITIHLREDRRHIQDGDVYDLKKYVRKRLNLEVSVNEEVIKIALDVKPDSVCIVPEKRQELTTEGGLDVKTKKNELVDIVEKFKKNKIIVSAFIDVDMEQILACCDINVDVIELHTGQCAKCFKEKGVNSVELKKELKKFSDISYEATKNGLLVNAGHGLDYDNIKQFNKISYINEFNIGFSIIAKSVFDGLGPAVKNMKKLVF